MLRLFSLVLNYLWSNKIASIVGGYILVSVLVKLFLDIDICIPCIWKTIFGFTCPGCGLTTALIKLAGFEIAEAYKANPLIFVIIPTGLVYLLIDFVKFKKIKTSLYQHQ
ncbi:MAG: hypothetical protein ACI86C_000594 [Candidatus Latescibacterota bacterium]|jgi:hypothetical protein